VKPIQRILELAVPAACSLGSLWLATLSLRHTIAVGTGLILGTAFAVRKGAMIRRLLGGAWLVALIGAFWLEASIGWAYGLAASGSMLLALRLIAGPDVPTQAAPHSKEHGP
jgi:hypothetical protein